MILTSGGNSQPSVELPTEVRCDLEADFVFGSYDVAFIVRDLMAVDVVFEVTVARG